MIQRWLRRLVDADAQLAADDALPSNATDEERNRLLLLAERAISTDRTDPLPASADAYRAVVEAKRAAVHGQARRAPGRPSRGRHASRHARRRQALLPLDAFDDAPFDLAPIEDAVVELTRVSPLAARDASPTEAGKRIDAATQHLADHDAAVPGQPRVDAIVAATKALLGEDALVVPEFVVPAALADEWEAAVAWSRTGQLTAHLTHRPAVRRRRLAARGGSRSREGARLGAGGAAGRRARPPGTVARCRSSCRTRREPWLALELPDGFTIPGDRMLYTAHYPVAFDKTARAVRRA